MSYFEHLWKNWKIAFHSLNDFAEHFLHGLIPIIHWNHYEKDCEQHEELKRTNADRIRAMSEEELAQFLAIVSTKIYRAEEKDSEINKNLNWLRSEV